MSKFNKPTTLSEKLLDHPDKVLNHESGLAFSMDAKNELVSRVLTALVSEDKFYSTGKDADTGLKQAATKVLQTDPEFVLKLAAYARNEMNLRSAPLFLLNEFANAGCHVVDSRKYISMCVQRVDEITELLAANLQERKKPAQFIKNGLRPCFNKFDRYQYGKYNRDGAVKLKDAIFLCHPKADTEARQAIFDDIVAGTLEPPETWEVLISTKGSNQENWEKVIPKMGYMALLRNLNNFLKHDVDLKPVIKVLTDENAVKKSKQLPFRFFSAYRAIQQGEHTGKKVSQLMTALNTALELSVENVPVIEGKTLVLVDASGSMDQKLNAKSTVTAADISKLFGAVASKICDDADVVLFAERAERVHFSETSSILDRMEKLKTINVGGATYAYIPVDYAIQNKLKYDRIFLFSDMQCYTEKGWNTRKSFAESFLKYQREVAPASLYSVDLVGYGTAQVPSDANKVCLLAGWSERIFDFVPVFEAERGTIIQAVEAYGKNK